MEILGLILVTLVIWLLLAGGIVLITRSLRNDQVRAQTEKSLPFERDLSFEDVATEIKATPNELKRFRKVYLNGIQTRGFNDAQKNCKPKTFGEDGAATSRYNLGFAEGAHNLQKIKDMSRTRV